MQNFDPAALLLNAPPPPTLRDIITAYRAKGNGEKDLLLAMLNAKAAEDQRLASLAALHKSMLEVYHFERLADMGLHPYSTTQSPPPSYGHPNGVHRQDRRQHAGLSPYHPYPARPHSSEASSSPAPASYDTASKRRRRSKSPRNDSKRVCDDDSVSPPQPEPRLISIDRSPQFPTRGSTSMAIGSLLRDEDSSPVSRPAESITEAQITDKRCRLPSPTGTDTPISSQSS